MIHIGVTATAEAQRSQARALAQQLDLPYGETPANAWDGVLILTTTRLEFRLLRPTALIATLPGPLFVDFVGGSINYRRRHGGGRQQPLGRAVGLKQNRTPLVLDATAGLGRDGFILAHLGCRVRLMERSPIIAALLADGLQRASRQDHTRSIISQLTLTAGDSQKIFATLQPSDRPDVVFLDPMYPHRSKSSLVKKEMRLLRAIVGADQDAVILLQQALQAATRRVVVKRPLLAPSVAELKPSMAILGKNSRYDVYLV